ncbi:MAG: response regulator [Acidobacteriaceae bacterium]|nr:response regulator [Acidobacteriaceae bacterium]MBV8573388.1 response regulator [Acidobacteriaceae bacterium]
MLRIVAVEHNQADTHLLKEALAQALTDCTLTSFEDAESAAKYLWAAPFHDAQLIILDLKLPGRSGLELLRDLKTDEHLCKIPVIVLAGSDSPNDIRSAYALHASCYILKRKSAAEHLQTLRTMFDFWSTTAALPWQETLD